MATSESFQAVASNRRYISSAMDTPMLSREKEMELARRWRDEQDEKALHELVGAYMRLVISIAGKFRAYGLPMSDLIQEGNVGLMQAAARFDPERDVRFSTYASWWIRSAMQEFILRNWSIVRTGTSAGQKSLFFNLRWLRARIDGVGAGTISPDATEKIASALKVSPRDVETMSMRLSQFDQSLNEPISLDGPEEWGAQLADEGPGPDEVVLHKRELSTRSGWLACAMAELTEREQLIIAERRLNEERVTLEELGGRLGITKERVRQIEHKAYEKLRAAVLRIARDPLGLGSKCREHQGELAWG